MKWNFKKNALFIFIIISFLFLLIFISKISFAVTLKININENSSLERMMSGQYKLITNGVLEITNPSNVSQIYEFDFPVHLNALIGVNRITMDSTSKNFLFSFNSIHGYIIPPRTTIKTGYYFYGLLDYNIYDKSVYKNKTIFEYYTDKPEFYTNILINIQKPQREGYVYDKNGNVVKTPVNNTRRLISSLVRNPTDFDCSISDLKIYRSSTDDPFFANGVLIYNKSGISLKPFENLKLDFFDDNSSDNSVYWISVFSFVNYTLTKNYHYHFFYEVSPSYSNTSLNNTNSTNSTNVSGGNNNLENSSVNPFVFNSILLKKFSNKTVILKNDTFKVYLDIVNIYNHSIKNLTLYDYVPSGYAFESVSYPAKFENGKLEFNIPSVSKYGSVSISYVLKNINKSRGITYLQPAKLLVNNKTFFSDGVLLLNELLANKKIFIQKNINYEGKYAKISIVVKNLGNMVFKDLLIKDNVGENYIFKDITKPFYKKGIWQIHDLAPGESWEVSYLTDNDNPNLKNLPVVFGAGKADVFGTIVSSGEVVTVFNQHPKTIEKAGLSFAVVLLILYLLF